MNRLGGDLYRVIGTLLGWGIFAGACLVWVVLVIPPTLLLSPLWPRLRDHYSDFTRWALRLYIGSLLFARVTVQGEECRIEGTCIVVANHQSWLDSILMIALEPRLGGPVRGYMFRIPGVRSIVRMMGFFQSNIGELPALDELQRSAGLARQRGGALLFFPEGTRSRTGDIGPFHRGAFRAAFDHDLPIQPVVIDGLDRALPPGHVFVQAPGRTPVRVRYLAPIEPPFGSGLRRDVVRELGEQVRGAIVAALAELRAEGSASPGAPSRRGGSSTARGGPSRP